MIRFLHRSLLLLAFLFIPIVSEGKLPEIDSKTVTRKVNEIMRAHISHKSLSPVLVERILNNYLEEIDPAKIYLMKTEIDAWLTPDDYLSSQVIADFRTSDFSLFFQIHDVMVRAIERRHQLDEELQELSLLEDVDSEEFRDPDWVENREELQDRLKKLKSLQSEAAEKLSEDTRDLALRRIQKRRDKYEDDFLTTDQREREQFVLSNVLKATASALDTHTSYLTPGEATQFMINVQQRLFGIGAQLRDDLNGFGIVKIIEGGPASRGGKLKEKDRIIAVDGEPVVGLDIIEAVELIRGKEGIPVLLRVVRNVGTAEKKEEETVDIEIVRGEVVLKESRIESSYEPYGDGVIGYIKLFSFYQDPEDSSAQDVKQEIEKLQKEHSLKGVILDLRYNSGGMLSQAVAVTGLFISKGIVVSIRDSSGETKHLRDIDGDKVWDGPLVVLTNRASASASEIVAQTLQDYGRAVIIGDDATFGKGTFQTFTLNGSRPGRVNPEGEYKVTRGRYYTVSGNSPQLTGVFSDIVVPGVLSESEIGERFAKYPLKNDQIEPNYVDNLSDVEPSRRDYIAQLYQFDLQPQEMIYRNYIKVLRSNSEARVASNKNYQNFLKEVKKFSDLSKGDDEEEGEGEKEDEKKEEEEAKHSNLFGQNDLQLMETYNVMKDLIILLK